MKSNPLVYIVMPCYNWEKYLLEQLMSIYYQNYSNWYLIFVNDGSTDNSCDIFENWVKNYKLHKKVKVIMKENGGVNSAIQRWLEEVKKICDINKTDSLVSYCDQDDIWTRHKLEIQVEYMVSNPDCWLSCHDMAVINENWELKEMSRYKTYYKNNSFIYLSTITNYMISTVMMFRCRYIDYILPMCLVSYQDLRTTLILSFQGVKIDNINQQLAYYRSWHPSESKTIINNEKRWKIQINTLKYIQERFPDKDIWYIISYKYDRLVNRANKNYWLFHIYFLMLFKYPKIFLVWAKAQLYRFYYTVLNIFK